MVVIKLIYGYSDDTHTHVIYWKIALLKYFHKKGTNPEGCVSRSLPNWSKPGDIVSVNSLTCKGEEGLHSLG